MSKLNVDQKSIKDLFQDRRSDFLIPDYQRPYAWGEKECQTLWDDIFSFAIPDEGRTMFDRSSEYFLGSGLIVPARIDVSKKIDNKIFLNAVSKSGVIRIDKNYKKNVDKMNREFFK